MWWVLDDSRFPRQLHAEGLYTLGDEMRSAATLPQRGGARLCSVHSTGDLLDPVIARITRGRPFRHVIGFEANERARADKDHLFDTELRTDWYPLRDWGWTRADCHDFVVDTLGESIPKSCCYLPVRFDGSYVVGMLPLRLASQISEVFE